MLEGVVRLVSIPELVEELEALELDQLCIGVRAFPDASQQLRGELPPQHGRGLEVAPGIVWQTVDARRQHALDRIGDERGPGCVAPLDDPRELFEEERVPLAPPHHDLGLVRELGREQ